MKFEKLIFLSLLVAGVLSAQCTFNYTLSQVDTTGILANNSANNCTNFVVTYSTVNATKIIIGLESSVDGGAFTTFPGTGPSNTLNGSIVSMGTQNYVRVNVYFLIGNAPSVNIQISGSPVAPAGGGTIPVTVDSTTTTLPYGTPASVTNIGSSSNVILHFSLPQGPPGVNGSSGSLGNVNYTFNDSETPGGTINGTNPTFTLLSTPAGSSLILTRNGAVQQVGGDYSLSGNTITFVTAAIPQVGDLLKAWYRVTSSSSTVVRFIDGETPAGVKNSTNPIFTLSQNPVSGNSLILSRNGLVQDVGIDFTLTNNTITFLTGSIPDPTDIILAWYRY